LSQSSALPSSNLRSRFPRVAITHEWLTIPGGSEKVVLEILKLLPQAEIFTTVYDPEPWPEEITSRPVHTTFLNKIPGARKQYPKLLPLMDTAWRRLDLRGFDLIVSSNHACAKNVRVPPGVPHVCYCHTPMRYAWDTEFMAGERLGPAQRLAFQLLTPYLRRTDRRGARGVDSFAANSSFVADRIARCYERKAAVIHPPVDVDRFLGNARTAGPDSPYLLFGRLVPYKKADVAVEACVRLGRPLRIAGDGRDTDRLKQLAAGSPQIEFLGKVPDEAVAELFASSRALLFPGLEDFGIVPVEAQAAGLPVVAYGVGGARDSVIDAQTGVLYPDQSADGLIAGIERFEGLQLDDAALRGHARGFAPEVFRHQFEGLLADVSG
jgi:glycosyltransferase involved in cell wall biosynthesis